MRLNRNHAPSGQQKVMDILYHQIILHLSDIVKHKGT
jgi:hypothetical protein